MANQPPTLTTPGTIDPARANLVVPPVPGTIVHYSRFGGTAALSQRNLVNPSLPGEMKSDPPILAQSITTQGDDAYFDTKIDLDDGFCAHFLLRALAVVTSTATQPILFSKYAENAGFYAIMQQNAGLPAPAGRLRILGNFQTTGAKFDANPATYIADVLRWRRLSLRYRPGVDLSLRDHTDNLEAKIVDVNPLVATNIAFALGGSPNLPSYDAGIETAGLLLASGVVSDADRDAQSEFVRQRGLALPTPITS